MYDLTITSLLLICVVTGCWSTSAIPQECILYNHYVGKGVTLNGVKCERARLRAIPDYLSASINYLEINYDSVRNITVTSLGRYGKIQYLLLKFAGVKKIEDGALSSLKKLVHLDLSGNKIIELPALPNTIETLTLDEMEFGFFDSRHTIDRITALKSLKKLLMRNNDLTSFPSFVREIPSLTDVFLDANNIVQLNVRHIAPLCNLKSFSFSKNKINSGLKEACQCQHVREWAVTKGIAMHDLSCPEASGSDDEKCKAQLKDDFNTAEDEYAKCRAETQAIIKTSTYFALGILPLLAAGICYYFRCWKRKTSGAARVTCEQDGDEALESLQKCEIEILDRASC